MQNYISFPNSKSVLTSLDCVCSSVSFPLVGQPGTLGKPQDETTSREELQCVGEELGSLFTLRVHWRHFGHFVT